MRKPGNLFAICAVWAIVIGLNWRHFCIWSVVLLCADETQITPKTNSDILSTGNIVKSIIMKWLIHIHSDVFKETLSTNSVVVLVFKRSMWPLKNEHVFVSRMTLCVFRRPRWKTSAYSVARGTGTGWRLLFMRVFPSAGLLEWWRQWWSSLFYRRQPKSIQQQRVNHSRRPSFITAERSGLIFKWKHFSTDMKSFFFLFYFRRMCAAFILFGVWNNGGMFWNWFHRLQTFIFPQKLSCQERRLIWL